MSKQMPNRWLILASAAIMNALVGACYVWSVFNIPLNDAHGWTTTQTALAYSLYMLVECFAGFAAGWLQNKVSSSKLILFGGACFAFGWGMAGLMDDITLFYLTFSAFGGVGSGFLYNVAVSTATKWFPDKRGMANGICLGSIGLSPLPFAFLGNMLVENFGVGRAFNICGVIFAVAVVAFYRFMVAPPAGRTPEGHLSGNRSEVSNDGLTPSQMAKKPAFYALWLLFAMSASSGMMITGHASGIGQQLASLTAGQAAAQVGIFAVANFAGRVSFGALSDRFGRYPIIFFALFTTALCMFTFTLFANSFISLTIILCIIGMCFGGIMTVMPAICADVFGTKHFGQNYAFVFAGYTAAAIIGPMLGATILESTGTYNAAFPVAGTLSCIAIALAFISMKLNQTLKKQTTHTQQ